MNTLSNIPKIVSIEFQKARHKHFPLLFLAALLLDYAYMFYGTKAHSETWLNIFYALPIINTLVLSVLMAVIASQSVDMEHKGAMWNLLPTLESRASVYLGKLFFGFISLVLFCTFQIGMVLIGGKFLGFTGDIPSHIVPVLFFSELIGGMILYQLQCMLSLLFSSQFAALSIAFGGTLSGLFLAFISTNMWTPWSVFFSLSPIGMDYDKASRLMSLSLRSIPISDIFLSLLYLIGTFLLGLLLFTRAEQGEALFSLHRQNVSHSIHSSLSPEFIKLKRNPIWIPFLLIPLISALIGTVNFMQNQGVLQYTWEDLWTQQSLFLGMFFLAPLIGILCSLLWRMEHQGSNWNLILTITSPGKLVRDKWFTATLLGTLCMVWITFIYLLSGKILGLPGDVPAIFWIRILSAVLSIAAITALQSTLSMFFHSFALPIALAFLGSLAGFTLTVKGAYYALPYSTLIYGMGSTSITGELNFPILLLSCAFYIVAALGIGILYLKKSDVRTHV